jgi:hypothetical protein
MLLAALQIYNTIAVLSTSPKVEYRLVPWIDDDGIDETGDNTATDL